MTTNKQQLLLDSALHLFVEQGIRATSTASIAKYAGVATGTLFHHFPTKQALIVAVYLRAKSSLASAMTALPLEGNAKSRFRQLWLRAMAWAQAQPDQLQLMLQLSHDPGYSNRHHSELLEATMPFLPAMLLEAQQQGDIADLPLPLLLAFSHHHFLGTARLLNELPAQADRNSYIDGGFRLLWQGLHRG